LKAKRTVDFSFAVLALLMLVPVLVLLALAIKASSRGPVIFRQRRVGRDGVPFDILKFRTMRLVEPGAAGAALSAGRGPGGVEGVDRRTGIGVLLRRTSLDELPQLLNVLRGDMSLVGPRPERPEFVALFGELFPAYDDRHRVLGGMTGLAQVRGLRGQTEMADRVAADTEYLENWSLRLDVVILLRTVGAVLQPAEPGRERERRLRLRSAVGLGRGRARARCPEEAAHASPRERRPGECEAETSLAA
jgi:lipopolysaccharide/colanic/teichoic acid biosynthesis glycosyltransferase